jgi:hypothetical protein
MRTNVVLNDSLVREAMALTGERTKRAVVERGLATLVRLERFRRLRRYRGKLELFDQLDAPGYDLHVRAARLHLALRRKGPMSSTVDALIVCASADAARVCNTGV